MLRYLILSVWLISFLLTVTLYQPKVVTVRVWNQRTQKMEIRNITQGYSKEQVAAIYLVVGVILLAGSFLTSGQPVPPRRLPRSHPPHVKRGVRRSLRVGFMVCPLCSSADIHSSRKRGLEVLLLLILVAPFRCYSCMRRFYSFVLIPRKP